jgi:CTP:molybdopterin cytidylyltransferase MocA
MRGYADVISAAVLILNRARPIGTLSLLLQCVLAANVDEVICVTDDLSSARREVKLSERRLFWYQNSAASRELSSSVIAALWASDPRSAGGT